MLALKQLNELNPDLAGLILFLFLAAVVLIVYLFYTYIVPKKYILKLILVCCLLFIAADRLAYNNPFLFFTGFAVALTAVIFLLIPKKKQTAVSTENG